LRNRRWNHVWNSESMESVSTRRRRIVLAAQKHRHEPLTALNHHLDLNWMHEAYRRVRKDAAPLALRPSPAIPLRLLGGRADRGRIWRKPEREPSGLAGAGQERVLADEAAPPLLEQPPAGAPTP